MKSITLSAKTPNAVRLFDAICRLEQPAIPSLSKHHQIFFPIPKQSVGFAAPHVLPFVNLGMDRGILNYPPHPPKAFAAAQIECAILLPGWPA
jgi:hypothetical protein